MAETVPTPPVLAPVPHRSPLIDRATLLVTRPWAQWLEVSWRRQGGADAPSNAELDAALTQTQADLAATQAELDATQAELAQTQADLAATQAELDATQAHLASELPPGPAGTVARYQADGSGVESTPGLQTTADGKLGIGVPSPIEQLEVSGALHLGAASATPAEGTLHWSGTDLEARVGGAWVSLTAGAGPLPVASETQAGIVPLATTAETAAGTTDSEAVTPLKLRQQLTAAHTGTPLHVPRYAASGTALEASLATLDATGTLTVQTTGVGRYVLGERSGLGTLTPETSTRHTLASQLNEVALAVVGVASAAANQVQMVNLVRRTSVDMLDNFGTGLSFQIADNAAVDNQIGQVLFRRQGADNSGRFLVKAANLGVLPATTAPGDLAVDPLGNVSLSADVFAHGGQRVLALGQGIGPSSGPADTVQLWEADRGGVATKGSLHLRTEDGTTHCFGDLVGLGTPMTATLGSAALYRTLNVNGMMLLVGQSSVQERAQAILVPSWVSSADATRSARLALWTYDATNAREGLRLEADGAAARLGFFGATAVVKPTVTGAKGGNAALTSVLSALASLGLVTDSTTA